VDRGRDDLEAMSEMILGGDDLVERVTGMMLRSVGGDDVEIWMTVKQDNLDGDELDG
jgi:hypothetical protein